MRIITSTAELADVTAALAEAPYVTVDTEFLRDTTYWPRLCLIQMAAPDGIETIVDPLSASLDLAPFFELMANTRVVKVFHAARQDVEIIHQKSGIIPEPLFDTQVAAMVCGLGDQIGYEALIRKLLDKDVDKSQRFTDWSRRPLGDKQLAYALSDVTLLRGAYEKLHESLQETGRLDWLGQELAVLTSPETYALRPEDSWRRLKLKAVKRAGHGVLAEVAAWREREAQTRDQPRQRILKDDAIYEIANARPRSPEALDELRGVPRGFAGSRLAQGLLEAITRGLARTPESLPPIEAALPHVPGADAVVDLLKVLLKACADEHGVAARLIAASDDLEALALLEAPDVPALQGWRYEIFGEQAMRLKRGEIALTIEPHRRGRFKLSILERPEVV